MPERMHAPVYVSLELLAGLTHGLKGGMLVGWLKCCLVSSDVTELTYLGQVVTSAEARFNKSLRPRKPEGSLGRTAQHVLLDSHTAPEL